MNIYIKRISDTDNPHAQGLILLSEIYKKPYKLCYGPCSKPYIANDDNFKFNISHSGEYVCLAVSCNEVGVDIERHDASKLRLAKRFYTKEEEAACHNDINCFFDIWTQKEAFIKANGIGLSYGLNTFSIYDEQPEYIIKNLTAPEGYSLSVCEKTDIINKIEIIYI